MTEYARMYYDFWSKAIPHAGGYLPAYPEHTVPANTQFPYITYTLAQNNMFDEWLDQVRVWTRSDNIGQLSEFLAYVAEAVPFDGMMLYLPDRSGALCLYRGTPFMQIQPVDDPDIKVGYVNIETRSYIH